MELAYHSVFADNSNESSHSFSTRPLLRTCQRNCHHVGDLAQTLQSKPSAAKALDFTIALLEELLTASSSIITTLHTEFFNSPTDRFYQPVTNRTSIGASLSPLYLFRETRRCISNQHLPFNTDFGNFQHSVSPTLWRAIIPRQLQCHLCICFLKPLSNIATQLERKCAQLRDDKSKRLLSANLLRSAIDYYGQALPVRVGLLEETSAASQMRQPAFKSIFVNKSSADFIVGLEGALHGF